MLERAIDAFLGLHGVTACAAVFLLAMLESAAFVGIVVPGEAAVILGGVLASRGNVDFWSMAAAASGGAIAGDSIGYWLGKRFGSRILASRVGRRIGRERWTRANEALVRRGAAAVVIGRFTTALRVMVPGLAGMAHMRYGRFLLANIVGGVLWALVFTALGYAAGSAWRRAAHLAGAAGVVLLALVALIVAIALAARWIARHPDRWRRFGRRLGRLPPVPWLRRALAPPLRFFAARFRPRTATGLRLTVGLVAVAGFGTALGLLVNEVLSPIVPLDDATTRWLRAHSAAWLEQAARAVSLLAHPLVTTAGAVLAALLWRWRRGAWRAAELAGIALVGGVLVSWVVAALVGRPPFPSAAAQRATVAYGLLAFLATRAPAIAWRTRIAAWATALVLVALVGVSELILARAVPTGVLGGVASGGLWLTVAVTVRPLDAAGHDLGEPVPTP